MKNNILVLILVLTLYSCNQPPAEVIKRNATKEVVLKNFEYISTGDMEAFQTTISDDFKFILSGSLKWNDGRDMSRTYEGYDSFMNDFLTPALETIPNGLTFNFDAVIADESGAAIVWHGASEGLYDTYNNKYVYIYEVNEEGLISSLTEYTDLLLSASSLLGQKINTNYKEPKE